MVKISEPVLYILEVDGVPAVIFHEFSRFLDQFSGFHFHEYLQHRANFLLQII